MLLDINENFKLESVVANDLLKFFNICKNQLLKTIV